MSRNFSFYSSNVQSIYAVLQLQNFLLPTILCWNFHLGTLSENTFLLKMIHCFVFSSLFSNQINTLPSNNSKSHSFVTWKTFTYFANKLSPALCSTSLLYQKTNTQTWPKSKHLQATNVYLTKMKAFADFLTRCYMQLAHSLALHQIIPSSNPNSANFNSLPNKKF